MLKRLLAALAFLGLGVLAQAAQTTVTDTIRTGTGALAQGVITVTPNQQFTTSGGIPVYPIGITVNITNGVFSVALYPNDATSDPLSGTSYTARYALNNQVAPIIVETWVVPTSGSPVSLEAVRVNPTPIPAAVISLNQLSTGGGTFGECMVLGSQFWTAAPCGSGITALTGDVTASGSGSVVATLATVNANVGTCGDATHVCHITLNAKGLATAASAIAITGSSIAITALTGDGTATGPGSVPFTLATVNSNTGSFGSSTAIPTFTVNGKGLITAASTNAVIAPAGTLSGTTLNSSVVTSSLTSVGTITSGVWNGTAIANANLANSSITIEGQTCTLGSTCITAAQATAFLNAFSSSLQGAVPSSGGGTTNFLRADGSWAAPGGSGTVTTTGSPANGNLTKFSGATSITNGDLSGDITTSGSLAATLATVNGNVGTFGSLSAYPQFTVNAKGLITAASTNPVCSTFASQTDAATVTWAIASQTCSNASLTFTVHSGSRTLNITNPINGGSYVLWIKQDGTGGEGLTLGTGCTWKVAGAGAGAIVPSVGANAIDVLAFTYDGGTSTCFANFTKNYT